MTLREDEILDMYAMLPGNPLDTGVDPEDSIRIFDEMSKINGIQEMLKEMVGMDMKLFWLAKSDLERQNIRGHAKCLLYMRSMMRNIEEKKEALILANKRKQ